MKKLVVSSLTLASLLAIPDVAPAHGGQYRGPGDIVPPGGIGRGRQPGRSPGASFPGGPSASPTGAAPATPGGRPAQGGITPPPSTPSAPRTGGTAAITPDLNQWAFWWEFNKDPYIDLREAIHAAGVVTGSDEFFLGSYVRDAQDSLAPTSQQVDELVLALHRSLQATDNRDITSSCLIALGKIGRDGRTFKLLDVMRPYLAHANQEIRESAAIAMGISQMPGAIPDLVALASDSPTGRSLVQRATVDDRTRSFACYGLGLIANATGHVDHKRSVYEALSEVLTNTTDSLVDRNVPVAAVNGIRLLRPGADGEKARSLQAEAIATLWTYYRKAAGMGEQQVQAHVPPAIAELLGRGGDTTGEYMSAFAELLAGKEGKRNNFMYQSAVIALGMLAQPEEIVPGDARYSKLLHRYSQEGKNEQTRYFALMGLAKIGGDANRTRLLNALRKGSKALVKPWAGLALGVLAHRAASAGDVAVDDTIGEALLKEFKTMANPSTRGALAIGLGLAKYRLAADDLLADLTKNQHQSELAGYLCVGLSLMGHREAEDVIRRIVDRSVRRPDLLRQGAIALGKLGDHSVVPTLQRMLRDGGQNLAKLSAIATALGHIGDRRSIEPLVKMLHDESITPLSRAFAAVALGTVADKEDLNWNSKIGVDMNYRATVETLTNGATGVLDIR